MTCSAAVAKVEHGAIQLSTLRITIRRSIGGSRVMFVEVLLRCYGGGATVPAWGSSDYDSLYVVRLTRNSSGISAVFEHDYEGLNGQPTACP